MYNNVSVDVVLIDHSHLSRVKGMGREPTCKGIIERPEFLLEFKVGQKDAYPDASVEPQLGLLLTS